MAQKHHEVGVARNSDELVDRLREAKERLGISNALLDDLAFLADGHTDKILGPSRTKGIGHSSLTALMDALAVRIVVEFDPEKLERMVGQYEQRVATHIRMPHIRISDAVRAQARRELFSELGKRGAAARNENLSAEQKSMLGRRAAKAKHRKRPAIAAEMVVTA